MKKTLCSVIVLASVVAGARLALAERHYWSMNAASCTVGDPAVELNRYLITAGSVKHRAAASGPITLYCPVTTGTVRVTETNIWTGLLDVTAWSVCLDDDYVFKLTASDSDGVGVSTSVSAALLRLSRVDGGFFAVPDATLPANGEAKTTAVQRRTPFTHDFDFDGFYYYVRVDLTRAPGTTNLATVYGVSVDCAR